MRISFGPASLAGAVLLAACAGDGAPSASSSGQPASATEPTRSRCFRSSQVNGWRAGDRNVVYLRTDVRRVFRMQLMGPCPDVNWAQRIGIEARGSSWICSGIDATIVAPSPIGPRRCPVRAITELTPEEVAAMPARHRP